LKRRHKLTFREGPSFLISVAKDHAARYQTIRMTSNV
jgi:hypothetical protein